MHADARTPILRANLHDWHSSRVLEIERERQGISSPPLGSGHSFLVRSKLGKKLTRLIDDLADISRVLRQR